MTERKKIKVEVINWCGDDSPFPDNLTEAIAYLGDIRERIPAEYRDQAVFVCKFERGYYDSGDWMEAEVYYERPETDEETSQRERDEAASEAAQQAENTRRELATLAVLRAKYEPVDKT